jgi:1,4-alpha-glucan branching enzyme
MTQTQGAHDLKILDLDPWLAPYEQQVRWRHNYYKKIRAKFDATGGLTGEISRGHHYFGFNRGELWGAKGVWYREWAPQALQLRLIGDFNNWDRMVRDQFGIWSLFLPDEKFGDKLVHGSKVKVHVVTETSAMDRIPAYIRRVVQDPHSLGFIGQYWNPPEQYKFENPFPKQKGGLRIYEAHVGMAQEEGKVGTFDEFTDNILPRIASLGLRIVRLSREQFLWGFIAFRHAGGAEAIDRYSTWAGDSGAAGYRAQPCGEEHA